MAKLTAAEFQEKHARRLKGSIPDIQRGVEKVTVSPTSKAADKQEKMKQKLIARIDDGTWAARLRKVTLEEWKQKTLTKGIGRISQGIDEAKAKVIDFAGQLLPHIDKVKADIAKLPDVTLEDSINRMTTFVRGMAKFRKK